MTSDPPSRHRRRVVVTGLGVVSPIGTGVPAFRDALRSGRSGVGPIRSFDPSPLACRIAGEVRDFTADEHLPAREQRRVGRAVPLALAAAREALAMAGIECDRQTLDHKRATGVLIGSGGGAADLIEAQYRDYFSHDRKRPGAHSISAGTIGCLSSELSLRFDFRGPSHVLSTGCTSSTDALGYGLHLIRSGLAKRMLSGGVDATITPGILQGFINMRAVCCSRNEDPARASRPFDRLRDGFVLGEGAWMFLLEERTAALERGAPVLAEVLGYGSTCDAYHMVRLDPSGAEPARAMALAIADGGAAKDEVGYISLHGTSTRLNDVTETRAIRECFGARAERIPMSAVKSMIGHPQGASGAAGLAATLIGLDAGFLPPTINLEEPDPECDLDYVPNEARTAEVEVALCNCIAFGSKNSALLVRRGGDA